MTYRRTAFPGELDAALVMQEFERIEQALELFDHIQLLELHAEPLKPRDGMIVLADGTGWNPGAGQGFYGRYASAWHKLG